VFLNVINILRNNCFIEFHTKNEAIRAYVFISIESELKRTHLTTIICNEYLKIIGLIYLELVPIEGYKLLVIFS
jgi:hypothetical protein